jgi:S-adenosylmethionine-diacylglycerol 3-amino-3-carboxypropyl transferase
MPDPTATWVERAAALPLAFAQVREDPGVDRWVVEHAAARAASAGQRSDRGVRVAMIASGGCTAALLATLPQVEGLHLVDPNPAQLALARLKLALLSRPPAERLALLGHAELPAAERLARLAAELDTLGLPADALGPPDLVARCGPDHAGRYEQLFAALRDELADTRPAIEELLGLDDPAEQTRRAAPGSALGRRLDAVFDELLALPNLVALFGADATRNPREPFARHFAARLRHVLATLPARDNPYLWQLLRGGFPPGAPAPWLASPTPPRLPRITWSAEPLVEALGSTAERFDVVHLSNILDWLTPERAALTLERAAAAMASGSFLIVRQLNSTLDVPGLGPQFEWLPEAAALHAADRSFFYRALHLGRRR